MNTNHERELEALIDRELKSLPPLSAPASLASRVMALVAARAVPWYRRAWQTWPVALQAGSLAVLLVLFSGLCTAGWKVSQASTVTEATQKVSGAFSLVNLVWKTLAVLGAAAAQVLQHLGTGFMVALFALVVIGYATFLAFGSYYVRFALARR